MINFVGQKVSMRIVESFLKKNAIPNAILISGEDHHGKSTFALEIAKQILSKDTEFENIYKHPNFFPIRSDDRMPQIIFFLESLKKKNSENETEQLRKKLLEEFSDLLSRYQKPFLPFLKEKKNSFIQGIKLSDSQKEEIFFLCMDIQKSFEERKLETFSHDIITESFNKLQNSIDLSLIPAESITKIGAILKNHSSNPRVIFIEQIEKIGQGQTAKLLKVLEDTVENTHFILSSNQSQHFFTNLDTKPLFSRCFKLFFRHYSQKDLEEIFKNHLGSEFPKNLTSLKEIQNLSSRKKDLLGEFENFLRESFSKKRKLSLKDFEEHLIKLNMEKEDMVDFIKNFISKKTGMSVEEKNKLITVLSEITEKIGYNLTRDYYNYKLYRVFD